MKSVLRSVIVALGLVLLAPISAALADEFPYERELLMDVKPLPGSKRVPILEVLPDGRAIIDLWCRSGDGRAEVSGESIKFTLGPMREEGCTPERLQRDEELAVALEQVTQWKIEDDALVLIGPTELRYVGSVH
jgi:heat shock protein HslJ